MEKPGVYILQSLKNTRYYIGSTDNISKRIEEHNQGKVKATRYIMPLKLKAFLPCVTITKARQAECRLKRYKRKDIIGHVIESKVFLWEYTGV